jgi:hypothetical protein
MLKVRLNLRKVAMVFACLAVTIVFATCGKNGGDDNDGNGGGKIDVKLIGTWSYDSGGEHHNYFFIKDGTAKFFITGSMTYQGEAKYSTSNNKISLTEYYTIDAVGVKELRSDKVVEYSIGSDERGEYLTIGNIPGSTAYGENRPNMKFRRD